MALRVFKESFCVIILAAFFSCSSAEDNSSKKEISLALKDFAPSETCPNVMCTKPPVGLSCNKTEVTNPNILNNLGTLKGCCSAFKCTEKDGSISTYFGMTGEEKSNAISNSSGSSTPQDKCSLIICPKPDEKEATCNVSSAPDVQDFKPKGDLQNCCPLYNCTVSADGSYHTRFVLSAGNVPKDPAVASKEKGSPDQNNKCPLVKCAIKPGAYGCEATSQNFSSSLQALGSFQECCPLWKCCFDDGTCFTHFEITSMSFWMAETSYFSSNKKPTIPTGNPQPEISDDNSQSESASPKGRSFGIQPAPGLIKPFPTPEKADDNSQSESASPKGRSFGIQPAPGLIKPFPTPEKADDNSQSDSTSPKGRSSSGIQPAPGLIKPFPPPEKAEDNSHFDSASPKGKSLNIQPKQMKGKTSSKDDDNQEDTSQQQQQQTTSLSGGSSKSTKSGGNKKKGKAEKESNEDENETEEETEEEDKESTPAKKKNVKQQQQQSGKGQQQQQQQMVVMQPVIINKIKRTRRPTPPPPPPEGLLDLSLAGIKVAK